MNELLETAIAELYFKLTYIPKKILEVFNDFFGKDHVDIQEFTDLDTFKNRIKKAPIHDYIPKSLWEYDSPSKCKYESIDDLTSEELKYKCITFIINTNKCISIENEEIKIRGSLLEKQFITRIEDYISTEGFILVYFPIVKITNEFNKSTYIHSLYAKIPIDCRGLMRKCFSLNRSEYPVTHLISNYMHSHVSMIPISNPSRFSIPCLGTGPIKSTVLTLISTFDLDLWKLFCLELQKYVETESLEGGPYHRLEQIGINNDLEHENSFKVINKLPLYLPIFRSSLGINIIQDFTEYFIHQKKLKFNYINNSYSIGMSFTEYILLISNMFIEWYNKQFNSYKYNYTFDYLLSKKLLSKCQIKDNKIWYLNASARTILNSIQSLEGSFICKFKGNTVNMIITDKDNFLIENQTTILNTEIALYILYKILNIINYEYGRTELLSKETDNGTSCKIIYI